MSTLTLHSPLATALRHLWAALTRPVVARPLPSSVALARVMEQGGSGV